MIFKFKTYWDDQKVLSILRLSATGTEIGHVMPDHVEGGYRWGALGKTGKSKTRSSARKAVVGSLIKRETRVEVPKERK